MSSHHFVREGQEPALLILQAIPFSRVAPLLEWVPHVVVAEQALDAVLSWGIKIDVVFQQDLAVEDLMERLAHQFPLRVIAGKNNLIKTAMEYLVAERHQFLNIVSGADPTLIHNVEKFGTRLQTAVYTDSEKWSYVTSGHFEKWLPIKHRFCVIDNNNLKVSGIPTMLHDTWRETTQSGVVVIDSPLPFWLVERFLEPESAR